VHHQEFGTLPGLSGNVETRSVVLDGDRLLLGSPRGFHLEWQRVQAEGDDNSSDSELRRALLGTWRLLNREPPGLGDDPLGFLVYTPDDHVFVQFATRAERTWPGPEVLEMPGVQAIAAVGFFAYCGTVEIADGQVVHHIEFGSFPSFSGRVEARTVVLDGDRLILVAPSGARLEWQRVHSDGEPQ
jgi:hypothetical protein